MTEETDKQRLDKWLWAARFFKTRALASAAINGGKVHVNGDRVKPSRSIRTGDRIAVSRGQLNMEVLVCALNMQRRPASEAGQLYAETAASIERRQQQTETTGFLDSVMSHPARRPGKKDRRQIARFTGRS